MWKEIKEIFFLSSPAILAVCVAYILVTLVTKKRKPNLKPKNEIPPKCKKNYIHLSLLEHYLQRYKLNPKDENSFFRLRSYLMEDGRKFVIDKIKAILQKSNIGNIIAHELLEQYKHIENEEIMLGLSPGKEDAQTPKIFQTSVEKYLKEYQMEDDAEKDLKNAILVILDKIYNRGKEQMLKKLEINMKWLEDYLSNKNVEKVNEEIEKIRNIITECEMMVGRLPIK